MSSTREILLTSESSGQLWNACAWDPYTGTSLITYKGNSACQRSLCILGKDYLLCAVNNKPLINVWALQQKDQMQMRIVCPGRVTAMTTSPDGVYCVAAIGEKIHLWQVSTGSLLAVLTRHYQPVTCIKFTDDGSHFITGGEDNLVIVWSLGNVINGNAEPRYTWTSHSLPITDIHVGTGGIRARVVSASLDHSCKLWEMSTGKMISSFVFTTSITSVAMDAGEFRLIAGAANGNIYQVHLLEMPVHTKRHVTDEQDEQMIFLGHRKKVACLSVSMDGNVLASGSDDCTTKLWDIQSRQCVRTLQHKGPLTNVILLPTPANMLNPDARPTLPFSQFKRSLMSGAQHQETQYDGEQARSGVVGVRLQKRKLGSDDIGEEDQFKKCLYDLQCKDVAERQKEVSLSSLHDQIAHLKKKNIELYKFSVDATLSQK